jgi:hypothetical protein
MWILSGRAIDEECRGLFEELGGGVEIRTTPAT